jgi:hypothetical protein
VCPNLVVPATTSTSALLLCLVSGGSALLLLCRILGGRHAHAQLEALLLPLRIGCGSYRGGGRRGSARLRARLPPCPPSGVEEVARVEGVRESGGGERKTVGLKIPEMREREALPHFAAAFAATAGAAIVAPTSAKPCCGTGCIDRRRRSEPPQTTNGDLVASPSRVAGFVYVRPACRGA